MNLENMKLQLANKIVMYMKANGIKIEEVAAMLEMTPETFDKRFNEMNYSFYSMAFMCCEKLVQNKNSRRVLHNEYK